MIQKAASPANAAKKKRPRKGRPLDPDKRRAMVRYITRTGLQRSFEWPNDIRLDPLVRRQP